MKRKVFLSLFVLLLSFSIFLFLTKKMTVSLFSCQSSHGECPSEILEHGNALVGKNYLVAKNRLLRSIAGNGKIKSHNLRFVFPSTLKLEIVERNAVVAFEFGEGRLFLFDENGTAFSEAHESGLPKVKVIEKRNDKSVGFAAGLFYNLVKYYGVTYGELLEFGLRVKIENVEVIFPLEGDVDVLLGSLEVVLLQLNDSLKDHTIKLSSGKNYTIDLRYKNPVVKEI